MIRNRADLKAEILKLLEATEDSDFQAQVDLWVDLGMQDIFSIMRAWWAVRAAIAKVEKDGIILLPPSYIEMLAVVPEAGPKSLDPIAPDQLGQLIWQTGRPPIGYLIEGNTLTLVPPQTISFQARYTYYSMLDPLDLEESTNAYLQRAFSACLYAGAAHGAVYRGDIGKASTFVTAMQQRVSTVNEEAKSALYATGVLMQRSR